MKKDEFYNDIKFVINIDLDVELSANPNLFQSLFENLFYFAGSKSFEKESFIQLTAWNANEDEVGIRIHDNGIGDGGIRCKTSKQDNMCLLGLLLFT